MLPPLPMGERRASDLVGIAARRGEDGLRYVHALSLLIAVAGAGLLLVAPVFGLSPTWMLLGLLLTWAGVTKLVVSYLWQRIFAAGRESGSGQPASPDQTRRAG